VDAYRPVREDLLRGAYAAYMIELLDRLTPDEQENPELYDLLRQALTWAATAADLGLAARYYELHLLSIAGYQPQLRQCVICNQDLQAEDQFFSPAEGGVVCPRCAASRVGQDGPMGYGPGQSGWLPLSLAGLKLLRYAQANTFARVAALNVGARTQNEVEFLLARYITIILERQLKSVEFLKLIRRTEPVPAVSAQTARPIGPQQPGDAVPARLETT
jgi:DNA repair protein RecO (recombination protein O)